MKTKKFLATLAVSALLLTGCAGHNKDAIVRVNDDIITKSDFNQMFSTITHNQIKDNQSPLYLFLKDRIVNELVIKKLLEQEINKRNITVSQEEQENAIKSIVSKYGSKENLQAILKQNGISNERFKQDIANEIKMKKLVGMLGSVNVTDSEVKKFYKENPDKFEYPEKVRASHILISANPKEIETAIKSSKENSSLTSEEISKKVDEKMKAKKAKAEKILAMVKANPNDFEKIARENSEDPTSGQKGGDLGFFAYKDMVEPFSKAAFSLKPNKVSDIVKSDYGYHIIIVKDRAKAGKKSFEQVQNDIKQYIIMDKQVKLLEGLITQLKNNAKIEYLDNEFKPDKIENDIKEEIKK